MIVDEVHVFTGDEWDALCRKILEAHEDLIAAYFFTSVQRFAIGFDL